MLLENYDSVEAVFVYSFFCRTMFNRFLWFTLPIYLNLLCCCRKGISFTNAKVFGAHSNKNPRNVEDIDLDSERALVYDNDKVRL